MRFERKEIDDKTSKHVATKAPVYDKITGYMGAEFGAEIYGVIPRFGNS